MVRKPLSPPRREGKEQHHPRVALEQIELADAVRALLMTDLWALFFEIVESTYLEFTLELCSTFHLQTVMTNFDNPRLVQFCLGGRDVIPVSASYDLNRSKASALPPSLRYLHAILAHTLTGQRVSIGVVTTHDPYFLWSMVNRHVFDLVYFITLAIRHQTE
ncbi:hypothetical protein GOBAR_AA22408 [Gossypium barbadense]|uniref:Uncharacterized protein n=1 Tax=Gossypium barbadense TaxID=3634 RepID=A0A2P5X4K2_GOSBA|nr:hypothetical protein GOBAR_AA22408 [Gossypium barbadense]